MDGIEGEAEYAPPSTLNCTLNPDTAGTVGNAKGDAHVLAGGIIVGAVGKTTTHIVAILLHPPPSLLVPVTV